MFTLSPNLKLLIHRTLPLTLGVFSIMLVQLVDTIFIGQLGVEELTVQGITLPFYTVMVGIQVGVGVAATAIISQAAGAGDKDKAKAIASMSVVFGLIFLALIAALLWLLRPYVFSTFISGQEATQRIELLYDIFSRYWPLWLVSALSSAALYLVSAVFRANQDTKTPGMILVAASIINLILDPLLIFTFGLGISGAAIASLIAFSSCTLYMLIKSQHKNWFGEIRFNAEYSSYLRGLINMVIPTTANQILPSVSAFLGMIFISRLGTDAIAFWSVLSRTETFLLVFTLSLTMSLPPIIGRDLGEGCTENIARLLTTTAKFVLAFHTTVAVVMALTASHVAPIMTDEPQLIEWLEFALWFIPFSYGPLGLCMVIVSAFNALGVPKRALAASFARLFVFYLPAIWIGTFSGDIHSTVIAATMANILAGGNAWLMLRKHEIFAKSPKIITSGLAQKKRIS